MPLGGSSLDGGDLPVVSAADVLTEFPVEYRAPEKATVRDAVCESWAEGYKKYQTEAEYAAEQTDVLTATGFYLDLIGEGLGVSRGPGEGDEEYRARILQTPSIVTPDAILAAVNAILGLATTKEAQLLDTELDCWFIHDGTVTAWDSFIGTSPRYPDRYYPDDSAENGGWVIDGGDPGGAIPMSNGRGGSFHLRLPPLEGANEEFAFILDTEDGSFIADGSDTSGAESDGSVITFSYVESRTADELYATIVSTVERIKGQGIVWSAIVDPSL